MTKDQSKRLLEKIIKDAERYNPEMRLFDGIFGSKYIETEYGLKMETDMLQFITLGSST